MSVISLVSTAREQSGQTTDTDAASGAVFLDSADQLEATITAGMTPSRWLLTVTTTTDRKLSALKNPVKLVCKGAVLKADAQLQELSFDYGDLWIADRLGSPDLLDPTLVQWVIEDNRRWVQDLQSLGVANSQRLANEFKDFPNVDAGGNFANFHRIPAFAHLTPTKRSGGGLKFARYDDIDSKVWTAFEMLQWMLGPYFDLQPGRTVLPSGQSFRPVVKYDVKLSDMENGFPLQEFDLDQPYKAVVNQLLRLAHLDLAPNNKGEWVVFRRDPKQFPRKLGEYTGAGHVVRRERSRSRSRSHRTIFSPRYELRANAYEQVTGGQLITTTVDPDSPLPIATENVALNPFDFEYQGRTIRRGTWQTFDFLIEAWNASSTDFYPAGFRSIYGALSIPVIKRGVLGPQLAALLSVDPDFAGQRHPRGSAIAKTIYDFYRRAWRIPAELRDNLRRIKAQSAEVSDPRSGRPNPSRVYLDHTMILTYYGTFDATRAPQAGQGFVTIRPWIAGDQARRLDGAEPSDYVDVRLFDPAAGVFLLQELPDASKSFGGVIFTTFSTFPPDALVDRLSADPHFLENATQHDEWRASWTFTAEPISPSTKNHFVVEKPSTEYPTELAQASGPVHEERFRRLAAGYGWNDDGATASIDADGILTFTGFDLLNDRILESIAFGLRQQHYFDQADWVIGVFKALGYNPDVDRASGNFQPTITHDDTGLFETVYDAAQPQRRPIFETITQDAARFLFGLDEDTL